MKYQRKISKISQNLIVGVLAKRVKKKEGKIEFYRHEKETRKNAVPVGLASYATSKSKPKKSVESIYTVLSYLQESPRTAWRINIDALPPTAES